MRNQQPDAELPQQPSESASDAGRDSGRPPNRGSWSSAFLWVVGTFGFLALVSGIGIWWFFLSTREKVGNPAAPRDLPRKYFAYVPSRPAYLDVTDEALQLPETGRTSAPLDIAEAKVGPAEVEFRVEYSSFTVTKDPVRVTSWFLRAPIDLDAWAKGQADWFPKTVGGKTAYHKKFGSAVIFQPGPKTIVVVRKDVKVEPDWQAVEELVKRGEDDFVIPAEQWDVLQQVSGYGRMNTAPVRPGGTFARVIPKFQATGRRKTSQGDELYQVSIYDTDARARDALADYWKLQKEVDKQLQLMQAQSGGKPLKQTRYAWLRGKYLHNPDDHATVKAGGPTARLVAQPTPDSSCLGQARFSCLSRPLDARHDRHVFCPSDERPHRPARAIGTF
jgi:hypothetical protein